MAQCLAANNIEGIAGILNGTTNFILTKMIEDGMTFEDALKLAQDNGYAEKDPTADIEGFDACRKVCILASLAFGKHVYPNQVDTEGITNITLEDVSYIQSANGVIKLLGQIKYISDDKIAAFVSPAVVFNGSQLASVSGVFNAILVRGDAVGDVCFYGQGAGKLATELEMPFYVRAKSSESKVKAIFNDVKFLTRVGQPSNEIAFITDAMTQVELEKKLDGVDVINKIRVTNY